VFFFSQVFVRAQSLLLRCVMQLWSYSWFFRLFFRRFPELAGFFLLSIADCLADLNAPERWLFLNVFFFRVFGRFGPHTFLLAANGCEFPARQAGETPTFFLFFTTPPDEIDSKIQKPPFLPFNFFDQGMRVGHPLSFLVFLFLFLTNALYRCYLPPMIMLISIPLSLCSGYISLFFFF